MCIRDRRGTVLDPFGHAAHRRAERALFADYEHDVARLAKALTADRLALSIEIAALPERIRGFDTVKDASIEEVRRRKASLEEQLAGADRDDAPQDSGKQHEHA